MFNAFKQSGSKFFKIRFSLYFLFLSHQIFLIQDQDLYTLLQHETMRMSIAQKFHTWQLELYLLSGLLLSFLKRNT